jgi:hypothetical protein
MGRMKQVYMEVVQENGLLPENFDLAEYKYKKDLADEEYKNKPKTDTSKETSDDKTTDTTGNTA